MSPKNPKIVIKNTLKIGGFFQVIGQSSGNEKAPAANPNKLNLVK